MVKRYDSVLKAQIKREYELGKSISVIMAEYNIGYTTVYNICMGNKYNTYMKKYRRRKNGKSE